MKLLSPKPVRVRGTTSVLWEDKRRLGRPCSEMSRMSADRYMYVGAVEASDWCTRHAILNSTRLWTGSQWSWRRTGVMWSRRRVLVSRRAAAFCTDWTFRSRYSGTSYNSELHQSRRHTINVWRIVSLTSKVSDRIACRICRCRSCLVLSHSRLCCCRRPCYG